MHLRIAVPSTTKPLVVLNQYTPLLIDLLGLADSLVAQYAFWKLAKVCLGGLLLHSFERLPPFPTSTLHRLDGNFADGKCRRRFLSTSGRKNEQSQLDRDTGPLCGLRVTA
jgi:hypothetical protein